MLALKNVIFTIVVPGTVTVLVPYFILRRSSPEGLQAWGALQYLAVVPIVIGVSTYLRCLWDFAAIGRGTPAPIDAPKVLVVRGLYCYVRNPMYVGVLMILLGEAMLFQSSDMLVYALGLFVIVHLFVVLYEEPTLRGKFGEPYERYCQSVRRWWPGARYRAAGSVDP